MRWIRPERIRPNNDGLVALGDRQVCVARIRIPQRFEISRDVRGRRTSRACVGEQCDAVRATIALNDGNRFD
jgi:hypothetical protein